MTATLTEIKSVIRMYKDLGRSKISLPICTVERMVREVEKAKGPMALEDQVEEWKLRRQLEAL